MTSATQRARHETWLLQLTAIPTAAGREHAVIEWIEAWLRRRRTLVLSRDAAGNLVIRRRGHRGSRRPVFLQAHLDHPAFVVRHVHADDGVELEFRGGVDNAYFTDARIEIFDRAGRRRLAKIETLDPTAKPFKRVLARTRGRTGDLAPGDIGRWALPGRGSRIARGRLHAPACDDLAGVAAALATLDRLRGAPHVGVLLTRAEEIGFVGTLAACEAGTLPRSARLLCLENSRSFPESPIGGGPILRVGDRMSVFSPELTNRLSDILGAHAAAHPDFRWQRKLMPGGACEATAFSAHGYESTCLCLPLGNYHNMTAIDAVRAGRRPARVGPEYISVDDFHHLVDALAACVNGLDDRGTKSVRGRLAPLLKRGRHVLEEGEAAE